MSDLLTERDLLASIRVAVAIEARSEVLDAATQLAAVYINEGLTQEGADVLAYILQCEAIAEDTQQRALDHWEDLERWICPRVLLDAQDFGRKATFDDLIDYIFA